MNSDSSVEPFAYVSAVEQGQADSSGTNYTVSVSYGLFNNYGELRITVQADGFDKAAEKARRKLVEGIRGLLADLEAGTTASEQADQRSPSTAA